MPATHHPDPQDDAGARLIALLNAPFQELDDELAACLVDGPIGKAIKHPLVVAPVYGPGLNAFYNEQLRSKQAEISAAIRDGGYAQVVWLHERPWRAEAFAAIAARLDDSQYWRLLAQVWIDSENIVEMAALWDDLLRADRPDRAAMMTDDEQAALAALPERIEVFQGHTDRRDDGWSWTTDDETATWFAHRFARLEGGTPRLSRGWVRRSEVFAHLLSRGEAEILAPPEQIEDRVVTPAQG